MTSGTMSRMRSTGPIGGIATGTTRVTPSLMMRKLTGSILTPAAPAPPNLSTVLP